MHKFMFLFFVIISTKATEYHQMPLTNLDSYEDGIVTTSTGQIYDEEIYDPTILLQQQKEHTQEENTANSVMNTNGKAQSNTSSSAHSNNVVENNRTLTKSKTRVMAMEASDVMDSDEMDIELDSKKQSSIDLPKTPTIPNYVRTTKIPIDNQRIDKKQKIETNKNASEDELDALLDNMNEDLSDESNSTNMQMLNENISKSLIHVTEMPKKELKHNDFQMYIGPTMSKHLLHEPNSNDNDDEYYEESSESMEKSGNTLVHKNQLPPTTATIPPSSRPIITSTTLQQQKDGQFIPNRNSILIAGFTLPTFGKVDPENIAHDYHNTVKMTPKNIQLDGITSTAITITENHNSGPLNSISSITVTPQISSITTTTTTTTPATITAPTTTIFPPVGKQGKQIKIQQRKLMAHEQLRNYIEDAYIRMPLAVIVDPSAESLEKTKTLWHEALRKNFNIKIILVSLNASGVPTAYNFNNTRQFLDGLNSIKEHESGDAFIGIVHASDLVPYDSAVFISTAIVPPHTELVQDAAITLLKKRIRLYVIWYSEALVNENETQESLGGILGEVAVRSGGEILHIVGGEDSQVLRPSPLTLVADAFRGAQEIRIPLDTSLANLHIKIDAPMRLAAMDTKSGDINLMKMAKINTRNPFTTSRKNGLDSFVPLRKLRKPTVYLLRLIPESTDDEYSVFVRADRKPDMFIGDMIQRFEQYFKDGPTHAALLKTNPLQNIMSAQLPSHANLVKFPDDGEPNEFAPNNMSTNHIKTKINMRMDTPKQDVETFSDTEIQMNQQSKNTTLSGDQRTDNPIQRASASIFQNHATKIEMGIQSQLLVAPGAVSQLNFELTNMRDEMVTHHIQVVDERRFLLRLLPERLFLKPGEKAVVMVTILVPQGTAQGTIDKITLSCHGAPIISTLSVNAKVISPSDARDTIAPTVSWTFGNRCDNAANNGLSCGERFWTMDITVQDWESGVLRLQTKPSDGLIYRNSYTVGTTEPMRASYIATCCEPQMSLTVSDLAGNQRSYNIDVRNLYLTEAAIAAIVLGVLLLILLIILSIWLIVCYCRRRQVSLDLPTYRSHSTRSME